ncbi:MAG: ATP synthase F1 subunit epsilon [Candidatus Ornithomonoglobus sp.]
MANTFNLKIYATDQVVYDGECEYLVLPASDGEFAILANHEQVLVAMVMGEMRYTVSGEKRILFTGSGFCYFNDNKAVIIADTAEKPEEIDERRAEEAKLRAEERLRQTQSKHDFYSSQAALSRALSRMQEAARHRRGM